MGYPLKELQQRLLEQHSDIVKQGGKLTIGFDRDLLGYVVELAKGGNQAEIFISKKDADACMQGIECYHLGIELGNFLTEFKEKTY
jgi:hypothetical protein